MRAQIILVLACAGLLQALKIDDAPPKPIVDLALTSTWEECIERKDMTGKSGSWEVAGPLQHFTQHPSEVKSWLCVKSGESNSGISRISFIAATAKKDAVKSPMTLVAKKTNRTRHTNKQKLQFELAPTFKTLQESLYRDACKELGQGWRAVEGAIRRKVKDETEGQMHWHMCAFEESYEDSKALGGLLTELSVFGWHNAHKVHCPKSLMVQVPGFDKASLLDDEILLCAKSQHKLNAPVMAKNKLSAAMNLKFEKKETLTKMTFPTMNLSIAEDPHADREHIFIVGPEGAGTRMVERIISNAYEVKLFKEAVDDWDDENALTEEFSYNKRAATFHLSMPYGSTCQTNNEVPVYDDFGPEYYEAGYEKGIPAARPAGLAARFMVDPEKLVQSHKNRNEKVKVFQVVRHPVMSFSGKMGKHCNFFEEGEAEQSKALELMVKAKDLKEVTTICYEEMVWKKDYLKAKLVNASIPTTQIPLTKDKNAKFGESDSDAKVACHPDMRAYMKLCPDSPTSGIFSKWCHEQPAALVPDLHEKAGEQKQ